MDDKGPLGAQIMQDHGHDRRQVAVIDANQLVLGMSWVRQGAENIEYSARANFSTWADSVPHGAMQGWGEQEAHAYFLDRCFHTSRFQTNVDAQGFQQIGATARA